MSYKFDPINNNSNNEHFQDVLLRVLENPSRRSILKGGLGLASMFALPMLPGCGGSNAHIIDGGSNAPITGFPTLLPSSLLSFSSVDKSLLDQIVLPPGYTAKVLHATGDTLNALAATYTNAGTETGDSWEYRVGDHHDGMQFFYIETGGKATYTATNKAVIARGQRRSRFNLYSVVTPS